MDRPIDASVKNRRVIRQVGIVVAAILVATLGFAGFRRLITPAVKADRIRTAVAVEGPIEVTVTASGTVVPMYEEVISSPIGSSVTRILKQSGQRVKQGEAILELDASPTRLALGNLDEQIALKKNERLSKDLELNKTLIDKQGRLELKQIDLESRQAKAQRLERLAEDGLAAQDELLEAQLDIRRTGIELRQLQESIDNLRDSMQADLQRIELETSMLMKQRDEQLRLLGLATAKAQRDGVLTFVLEQEGASVGQGEMLARVADLTRFQVQATLSDVYSAQLAPGMPVRVSVGGEMLAGTLETIRPTIEGGTLTVIIQLDDPSSEGLRSNLRVDTYIITAGRDSALLVRQGPFVNGSGPQQVFVVRDRRAYRTDVDVGLESYDQVEIVSGLKAGDEVIISDMQSYLHMEEVGIH